MDTNATNHRRLQNEVRNLKNKAYEYEKMFKIIMVGDDMYHWTVTMYGPESSLYEESQFELDIILPVDYPFSAPRVKFISPILHVNVNNKGDICLNILKNDWAASLSIISVMVSIHALLASPNPDDPFNSELAQLYRSDKNTYEKQVRNFCLENNTSMKQ